ncbi:Mg2+ transport protein [Mycoplasma haemofelis Ohio2]|uniref:Mg2+ transport protein n=1 Tax=Mycoplasma haemofelis (strain Ohio2) TaxID=859194 RepID=F6FJS6_MYCHI|nr:Mg2+ transport protein [Mycoplasma haemofelis Ohio2]
MLRNKLSYEGLYERQLESLTQKVFFLYDSKNDAGIKSQIRNQPLNLLVEAIEKIDDIDLAVRFIVASYRIKMGELFLSFTESNKIKILSKLNSAVLSQLLNDLNSDDVYEILNIVPSTLQKKILLNSSRSLKLEIKELKSFDFGHVGSIMNNTFVTFVEGMNIGEAINFLHINKDAFDIGEEIFVTNTDDEIVGFVRTKNLLFHRESESISEVIEKSYFSVGVSEGIDEVIDLFKKYSPSTVAVIDENSKLVGIVNSSDVIPEIIDNNMEDVYHFYGIRDTYKTYLNSDVMEIVKSRIFCLIITLLAATVTTYAIDKFETLGVSWTAGISSAILVPIIPIITDMCGNTGSQTTATIIQAVASGEVKDRDIWKVIRKELKVALVIGLVLALFNFCRLIIYYTMVPIDSSKFHLQDSSSSGITAKDKLFLVGMVGAFSSSISLFLVVLCSKFFGVLIPFMAIRFNYDPASISAPVLTTILDTVSSVIFFGIGVMFLNWTISPIFGMNVSNGKLTGK